ncbi:MAG TPA: class I SAM-dependent methyltransferase [Acidimicrobiia bacterium]|nr:class I SAM-dependent methyltransferase [Acidimicrobiia bacterium]
MTTYDSRRYAMINRWDSSHLKRIDRLVAIPPGADVLEVGCGQGHLTRALADRGINVIGIDANPQAEAIANTPLVKCMRAEALDFEDESFDFVVSVHAIEHIPDLDGALSEIARVLRPGGKAIFIYPAEPIMGMYAIPTSVILHGTPFKAREVHCQKLWPSKLKGMVVPLGLGEIGKEFSLFKSPQFASVFEKVG